MTYRIEITRPAQKSFRALDGSIQARVIAAIRALAEDPHPAGSTKMVGRPGYRIRIGDYRVIYDVYEALLVIDVIEIGHRREVYR